RLAANAPACCPRHTRRQNVAAAGSPLVPSAPHGARRPEGVAPRTRQPAGQSVGPDPATKSARPSSTPLGPTLRTLPADCAATRPRASGRRRFQSFLIVVG